MSDATRFDEEHKILRAEKFRLLAYRQKQRSQRCKIQPAARKPDSTSWPVAQKIPRVGRGGDADADGFEHQWSLEFDGTEGAFEGYEGGIRPATLKEIMTPPPPSKIDKRERKSHDAASWAHIEQELKKMEKERKGGIRSSLGSYMAPAGYSVFPPGAPYELRQPPPPPGAAPPRPIRPSATAQDRVVMREHIHAPWNIKK